MHLPSLQLPERSRFTQRSVALVATLLVHLLLLLIVLLSRSPILPKKAEQDLSTFSIMPDPEKKAAKAKSPEKKAQKVVAQAAPAAPPKPTPVQTPNPTPPSFIQMDRDTFASSNIANLPSHAATQGTQGTGAGSAMAMGPGEGPGGSRLFPADWYRHPSDAELSGYLPANSGSGWGEVACKTIEHYHVENCQTLGESPLGSGLARAVREAAWQFLVKPPNVDGKPMVGAWVRIRIDYTRHVVRQQDDAPPGIGPNE